MRINKISCPIEARTGAVADLIISHCSEYRFECASRISPCRRSKEDEQHYEAIAYSACTKLHLANMENGRTLGHDKQAASTRKKKLRLAS
jgi:hypothetical protein